MLALVREKKLPLMAFVFVLALVVGVATSYNKTVVVAAVLGTLGSWLLLKFPSLIYKITLIGILTIPYGNYDFFHLTVPYLRVDVFNLLLFVLLGAVAVKAISNKKLILPKVGWTYVLWISVLVIYAFIGRSNIYLTGEVKIFSLYVVYLLSMHFFAVENKYKSFLKILIVSSMLLSVLVILMYFFKGSLFYALYENSFYKHDTRVGSGNQSIFIIAIPLLITALNEKILNTKWKLFAIGTIILMGISVIMNESRVLIAAVAVNTVISFLVNTFTNRKRSFGVRYLQFMAVLLVAVPIIFAAGYFLEGNDKIQVISDRFNQFFQTGTSDSLQTREVSNANVKTLVDEKPLGHGLGAPMDLFDRSGYYVLTGSFIDNGFYTLLYKIGVIGFAVYALFYLIRFIDVFKASRQGDIQGKLALTTLICIPLFVINCMVFTAQLAMNGAVFSFILMLLALFKQSAQKKRAQ